MSAEFRRDDAVRFRDAIAARLGFLLPDGDLPRLEKLLDDRLRLTNARTVDSYLTSGFFGRGRGEAAAVAERIGVFETHFLRHPEQLRAFTDTAVPACLGVRKPERESQPRLRILSAGCASGEEPYTLAILLREHFPHLGPKDVEIVGLDVNPLLLQKATLRRYSEWSFRQTPPLFRRRYFQAVDRDFRLHDEVAAGVSFEERNLVDEDLDFYRPGRFDIVFCRNVVMYFTPQAATQVIARLGRALAPDGYLFLGAAETLRGLSDNFHLRHVNDAFFYQPRGSTPRPQRSRVDHEAPAGREVAARESAEGPQLLEAGWMQVIMESAARVGALTEAKPEEAARAPPDPQVDSSEGSAAKALLGRAVFLADAGALGEAERLCLVVLGQNPFDTEARYLLALVRAQNGDRWAARAESQAASDIDPSFAMPHLHLALLAKTEGHTAVARREFAQALDLLAHEESSRIVRFGGGFSRETLMRLCRVELGEAGGER